MQKLCSMQKRRWLSVIAGLTAWLALAACDATVEDDSAGARTLGQPCTPSLEYRADFGGFSLTEVTVEQNHPACGDGVCMVNRFQGRTSCPQGQGSADAGCTLPGSDEPVTSPVCSQCSSSSAHAAIDAVYCSCRCGPPSGQPVGDETYCSCSEGFDCVDLIWTFEGDSDSAGKYCVKRDAVNEHSDTCGEVQGYWSPACHGTPPAQ